ncbi:hypothetical protein Tco_1259573 [Tanacetum coccineum]
MEECDDLQLQTTSNFKADHVDAYDLDCDDEATTCAIFMASLSPARSLNGDTVAPTYDSDIPSEVPHYDTYHENDVPNSVVQEMEYIEHFVSNNDSYDELTSDNNVISYADYMVTIENDAAQYVPPPTQDNAMILSVIEQMKSQVEKCNTVNQENKSVNESLPSKLEQYKEKIKSEPINAYFKNKRVVHHDYLKVTKEHVDTLQELLEQSRALKTLDENLVYACKFAKRIQELLVYVSDSCPFTQSGNEKWAPTTSHRKNNKPYVDASI